MPVRTVLSVLCLLAAACVGLNGPAHAARVSPDWTVQLAPLPAGTRTTAAMSTSVSCASDALCSLVIGETRTRGKRGWVADVLSATGWTSGMLPFGDGATTTTDVISGVSVSCTTAPLCLALPEQSDENGFARYDGDSWTGEGVDTGFVDVSLHTVACGVTRCVALGKYDEFDGRSFPILAERDNATGTWQRVIPRPRKTDDPWANLRLLTSPSCAPDGACLTLGYATNGFGYDAPYLLYRDADGWQSSALPVPPGIDPDDLVVGGLSCSSGVDCAALATYTDPAVTTQYLAGETLIDGGLSVVQIPIPDSANITSDAFAPRAVDCARADRCAGVIGFRNTAGRHGSLLVRWDGARWTSVVAPAPAGVQASAVDLTGMACPAANRCVATGGYRSTSGRWRPLVESFGAGRWTAQPLPVPDGTAETANVRLDQVSCGSTVCVADGSVRIAGSVQPLVATTGASS